MLVSAQNAAMKVMEDRWGEKYLSTFPQKSTNPLSRMDKHDFLRQRFDWSKIKSSYVAKTQKSGKTSENRRTRSVWTLFFSFFRRSGIFIKYMKSAKIRRQFEVYLQTIGRDPTCFKKEGWSDIRAVTLDSALPHDIGKVRKISCFEYLVSFLSLGKVYHRKKYNGSYIIGEFVLNDFRFWREMECFKRQAVYLSKSTYREVLPHFDFLKFSCVQTKKCL